MTTALTLCYDLSYEHFGRSTKCWTIPRYGVQLRVHVTQNNKPGFCFSGLPSQFLLFLGVFNWFPNVKPSTSEYLFRGKLMSEHPLNRSSLEPIVNLFGFCLFEFQPLLRFQCVQFHFCPLSLAVGCKEDFLLQLDSLSIGTLFPRGSH